MSGQHVPPPVGPCDRLDDAQWSHERRHDWCVERLGVERGLTIDTHAQHHFDVERRLVELGYAEAPPTSGYDVGPGHVERHNWEVRGIRAMSP